MIQSKWKNISTTFFVLVVQYQYFNFLEPGHAACAVSVSSTNDNTTTKSAGLTETQTETATATETATYDDYGLDRRKLASLSQKWNLTEKPVVFKALNFELGYIVSDFILDSMMSAVAYTTDCQEGGIEIPQSQLAYNLIYDDTPPGDGDFERNIAINVTVQPTNNDEEESLVYKNVIDPVTGAKSAVVDFCMRFSLLTPTATPIEANYLETVVGFRANLTAGFQIDTVSVEPKDKVVATALKEYEVDAFLCDENNNEPVTGDALTKARTQGQIVRACVTPNKDARDDGIFMRAIKEFTWYRDYGGALGMVSQVAVQDSKAAPNFLTVLYCTRGDLVCAFESVLFASMFLVPGEVYGTGTALMQFGDSPGTGTGTSRSRRQLGDSNGLSMPRSLQEGGGGGGGDDIPPSKFDLGYEVRIGEKFTGMLKTSSSSKLSLVYPIIATGVTTVFLNLII
eukprot:jgi/Psemu1/300749/fgenesh1_kg.18_\